MAIGIVSDADFTSELASFTPLPPVEILPSPSPGRAPDQSNTPESLRKIISDSAIKGESPDSISEAFGISKSSISAYKNGATSTASYHQANTGLTGFNQDVRLKISSRAKHKILAAMKHITEEKLRNVKARDLAGIAKDMSHVVRNMEPSSDHSSGQNNFVFFAPRTKSEEDYEIIPVSR